MKLNGGLAWLAAFIILTHTTGREAFDSPHVPHEDRSLFELNSALSSCPFSVTGNVAGPSLQFKTSIQNGSLSFHSEIFSRDDYDGGGLFVKY